MKQMIRNTVTGHEFDVTPDLIKFAANPANNLEVIDMEEKQQEVDKPDDVDVTPGENSQLSADPDGPGDDFPLPPAKKKQQE